MGVGGISQQKYPPLAVMSSQALPVLHSLARPRETQKKPTLLQKNLSGAPLFPELVFWILGLFRI